MLTEVSLAGDPEHSTEIVAMGLRAGMEDVAKNLVISDFSSLLSSSVSFSSSSELSSTAVSSGAMGAVLDRVRERRAARNACQSWRAMRTKSRWGKAGDASAPLGRMALSGEETDGRRDGGRDALRDMAGPRREEAEERMLGLTSAGDE